MNTDKPPVKSNGFFSPAWIGVNALRSILQQDFVALALTRNISMQLVIEPSVQGLVADYGALQEIFRCFITNAIQHNREGGEVVIRISQEREQLICDIQDNGPGMMEESIHQALVRQISIKDGGIALAKLLIELHRGTLQVTSHYGQGVHVVFSLPINKNN